MSSREDAIQCLLSGDSERDAEPGGDQLRLTPNSKQEQEAGQAACGTPGRWLSHQLCSEDAVEDFAPFQAGNVEGPAGPYISSPLPLAAGLLCYVSSGNSFHYLPSQLN